MKAQYITDKELKVLLREKVVDVIKAKAPTMGRFDLTTDEALSSIVFVQVLRFWAAYIIKVKVRVKGSRKVAWPHFRIIFGSSISDSELCPHNSVRIRV